MVSEISDGAALGCTHLLRGFTAAEKKGHRRAPWDGTGPGQSEATERSDQSEPGPPSDLKAPPLGGPRCTNRHGAAFPVLRESRAPAPPATPAPPAPRTVWVPRSPGRPACSCTTVGLALRVLV
eukprot:bmy_14301T0